MPSAAASTWPDPTTASSCLKPSGQLPHEGGQRFTRDSWQYQVIRAWVAHGAKWGPGDSSMKRIDVEPRA